jgi:hypothetical protein
MEINDLHTNKTDSRKHKADFSHQRNRFALICRFSYIFQEFFYFRFG